MGPDQVMNRSLDVLLVLRADQDLKHINSSQLSGLSIIVSTCTNILSQTPDPSDETSTSSAATSSSHSPYGSAAKASDQPPKCNSPPQDDICEVINTPDRGLGVFALRKIKAGTLIIVEQPLIAVPKTEENDLKAIERNFSSLSRVNQRAYLKLFDAEKSRMSRTVSVYYSNCYNCEGFTFSNGQSGGSAVGALSSRLNHSCIPNVQFSYHEATNQMRFYAIRDIPRGKEVLSNYDKAVFETSAKRQKKQMMYYGFRCECEACVPRSDFWKKSDERRKGMLEALKAVRQCEAAFVSAGDNGEDVEVINRALEALLKLERLLVKEGLVGVPLANTFRSLAKWSGRRRAEYDEEEMTWKAKEREVCVVTFGKDARRTIDIEERLRQLTKA